MALLQAQSREKDLQTAIRELQEEIESNHNIASMAMETAGTADAKLRQELADLQSQHASSLERVESLQSTIAELELNMHKMTSESVEAGFVAQRLVEVERLLSSASESEQKRVNEIEHQLSVIRELRQEVDEQHRMLEFAEVEYEILLESSRVEHQEGVSTIEGLHERLEKVATQAEGEKEEIKRLADHARQSLQQELNTVQANLSAMELSLKENTDSLQAFEDRTAKLRSLLQEREKEVQRLKASIAETGQPIDGVVSNLRQEVNDLEARIERRNRQIALEQEKARKLGLNLQLAQDTVEEQDAALQETRRQLSLMENQRQALQAQVHTLESASAALAVTIQREAAQAAINEAQCKRDVAELENELLDAGFYQQQLVLQVLVHRRHRETTARKATAERIRLSSALSEAAATGQQLEAAHREAILKQEKDLTAQENLVAALQSEKLELDGQVQALRIALSTAADTKQKLQRATQENAREFAALTEQHLREFATLGSEVEALQATTRDQEHNLVGLHTERESLHRENQTLQADMVDLQQKLDEVKEELRERQSVINAAQEERSNQQDTTVELEASKAELDRLQHRVEELTTSLAESEQRYSTFLERSQENEAVLVLAKDAAEEEMTRRTSERDALRQQKDALSNEVAALQEAMEQLQQSTASTQQRLEQTIEQEQQSREQTGTQLSALSSQVLHLRESLERANAHNKELVRDIELAREAVATTESQKDQLEHDILEIEQRRAQLEARLSDLQTTIGVLQEDKAALMQESEASRSDLAANADEIASLRAALAEQRREIDTLYSAKSDLSSQEKRVLEETQHELARGRGLHQKRYVWNRNVSRRIYALIPTQSERTRSCPPGDEQSSGRARREHETAAELACQTTRYGAPIERSSANGICIDSTAG